MQPVLTVAQMRAVDAAAQAQVAEAVLVERAGTAVAGEALRLLGGAYGRRVVVVAGPGNNGADGRVAARRLRRRGAAVRVLAPAEDPEPISGPLDLVIDAAFGTGFRGSFRFPAVPAGVPVLAVDIPSGVDGDTGRAAGRPQPADVTVTFAAVKPGLLQGDGAELAGRVVVADIGLPSGFGPAAGPGAAQRALVDDADVALVPTRPRTTNKWRAAVLVVAGSPGMLGAAELCCRGAYRAGAGMVRLLVPGASPDRLPVSEAVAVAGPAAGWASDALDIAERCQAVVVGPGLGRQPDTAAEVRRLVERCPVPVVVDGDGLVALSAGAGAAGVGRRTASPLVLTPHDGEFARLAGAGPGDDRMSAASQLAADTAAVVLLKGSTTVVAAPGPGAAGLPEGVELLVATAGSARLATAGSGDVLSGLIGAFMARGAAPAPAAAVAAHVHGRAAGLGRAVGLTAGDLPDLVARWLSGERRSRRRGG